MKHTHRFSRNLFLSIGGIFVLFAIFFSIYQYNREKEYKIDIMQSRLQMYNYEMAQSLGDSLTSPTCFNQYVSTHSLEGLRITLIDTKGNVILDSKHKNVAKLHNHLHRTEVQQALKNGNGYDLKRASESTNETYFYSATRIDNTIIRTAIPYSAALTQSLEADYTFLYYAVILTILLGFALFYNTSRIGKHISHLRKFAKDAEEGKEIREEWGEKRNNDELDDISHTIMTLYWKLRHSEEDKARIKRQLTQNAAHELKTPAASIHGYLESIISNPDMPIDKRQHFIERCYAQSERMNKLLLDMAMLTKLDDSTTPAHNLPEMVDVKEIVSNALDDVSLQLQEKGITPQFLSIDNMMVHGDANLIYGIFRNLLDNTIAYATGATVVSIQCTEAPENAEKDKNLLAFTYSDNGCGVDKEHLPHLFERFYRVDKGRSRKLGGTGLGLAIVKNAVIAHGGTCTATTSPGEGLTIHFTIAR